MEHPDLGPIPHASEMACQALGIHPQGNPYTGEATHCAMCRAPITRGSLFAPAQMPKTFTLQYALSDSGVICGHCVTSTNQAVLRKLQSVCITPHGVYPISKDVNRAWWLLTPPEGPMVNVISTGMATVAFHLHWQAKVTLDNRVLRVFIDDRHLIIRRNVLKDAIGWCKELADLMQDARPVAKRVPNLFHPFRALDRKMEDLFHGVLRSDAVSLDSARARELRAHIAGLTTGELWALATLAKANTATPEKPAPITSLDDRETPDAIHQSV